MDTQITDVSMKLDCITNFLPLNCLQGFHFFHMIWYGSVFCMFFFLNFRLCKYVDFLKVTNSLLT